MGDVTQVEIQFDTGMSMRSILSMPQLKGYRIGQLKAILLSPTRINDILPFLHKPKTRPTFDFQTPHGSIFRGQVFGHISVFSNKSFEKSQALVLLETDDSQALKVDEATPAPALQAGDFPPYDPVDQPVPAAPASQPVSMVGFPSSSGGVSDIDAPTPVPDGSHTYESLRIDPYPTPSPEKLKRWTEIIPSSTRVRKAQYPDREEADKEKTVAPLPDRGNNATKTSVICAKEADHLIRQIIDISTADPSLTFDAKSDFIIELKILQMELSKFHPGIPRIVTAILAISDFDAAGKHISRLKECLRGLGLLL
jgi:hypothetical protein